MMTTPPPPPPRRSRKTAWLIAGGVAAVAVLICCGAGIAASLNGKSGTGSSATPAPASQQASAQAAPATGKPSPPAAKTPAPAPKPELGKPVRDGKFEFTVTAVKCGVKRVGSQDIGESAQGQFCLVTLRIHNIGDHAATFTAEAQKAYNAAGQEFEPASTATLYVNPGNGSTLWADINPGNSVTGVVVWDIAAGAVLTRLELHDSLFSSGAQVRLS